MFDAGFLEMLIIGLIALLVVGPERLPTVAAKAGSMVAKIKAFVNSTKADIERELRAEELQSLINQQKQELNELRDIVSETQQNIRQGMDKTESAVSDTIESIKQKDDESPENSDTPNNHKLNDGKSDTG